MKHRLVHILCCLILCVSFSANGFAASKPYRPFRYSVIGIDNAIIKKNVDLTLLNYRSTMHLPITAEEVDRFMRKAPRRIQKAVKPYGYFQAQAQSSLTHTQRNQVAEFDVTLGPALPIKSIQIDIHGEGKTDHKFVHFLKKHIPFQVGSRLQTAQYEAVKEKLYDIANERGYFQAKMIKSQIRINEKNYDARIIIIFDTGPRFRFGKTTFSASPFHEAFLKKYLEYKEGHHYNAKKLEKTQTGLVASNYFNQVLIKPEPAKAVNGYVPIKISFILRKKRAYTFGLGYGTDTGARATVGYTIRRIGQNGQRFHTLLRASQDNSSFTAKYIIPGPHPAHDIFTIATGVSNIIQSTGSANNAKFALNYTIFDEHWKNSLTLAYLDERYNIVNVPTTSAELVYPTFESKYINTDHITHPTRGINIVLQLTGADQQILSKTSFMQETLDINTLYTIKKTHTRLLFRTDLGHTDIANIDNLPLSLQLFAGGSRSIRGYGYNSIPGSGPARNLVVASTEIQQRMVGALYLAGFIDAGVVANNNIFQHINAGTGPGLAWISPIGTIELTIAEAFTQSNKPWTIQFTMGSAI